MLASAKFKQAAERRMREYSRYYRIVYSSFALVSLVGILVYQYSLATEVLFDPAFSRYIAFVLGIPGVVIMIVCINRYFYHLSGIQAFRNQPVELQDFLVVTGIHGHVRHPLYLGTLMFVWGLFLAFPLLNNLIALIVLTGYTLVGINIEEKKLMRQFGERYRQYKQNVPMLLPRLRWGRTQKNKGPK